MPSTFRWEYSRLAKTGNFAWEYGIDWLLRRFANDIYTAFQRIRGLIQLTVLFAVLLLPLTLFYPAAHLLTASGLLFDIAGALRLFLLEELTDALEPFKEKGTIPSSAMRELIMPEASGPAKPLCRPC